MYILALVLSLFLACAHSRMLLGSSEDRRTFYHSIRDLILVEDVDLATGFKYGECSHLVKGRVIRVSFFTGRFYPHYKVTGGDVGYLSDEAAYKACIGDYKKLKIDVLYDIGLTALALADFAKELGMTRDLNAVPALEFVINIAKRNIDRSDVRRLAHANPKFLDENLKYGSGNSEGVHFGRPVEITFKEPKDFINRHVEDIYFGPKDFNDGKYLPFGKPADLPSRNYFADVRAPQRDRVEVGGRDSQRDRVEVGGRDSQRERIEVGGRDSQRDRVEVGGWDFQRDRVEAGGRDSQRDRVEAGGRESRRETGLRPAGSREPVRDFTSTESDSNFPRIENLEKHYLL